ITALFGLFSRSRNEFTYINAGHLPPLVRRSNGALESPAAADLVIGVLPEVQFTAHRLALDPGDFLILYTDGITEAISPRDEMFGEERLEQFVQGVDANSAEEMCRAIEGEIAAYRATAEQSDDITLLTLHPM
ncbi:MAG: serine/threonine-protein phosphatase, partial [Candidatus Zixiibacteriota bacterium]